MDVLVKLLKTAVKTATGEEVDPQLVIPEEQFGDFTTNVALQMGQKSGRNPRELALRIVEVIPKDSIVAKATVDGPGFINLVLTDTALWELAETGPRQWLEGNNILLEYSCPNAFKELHTGHLYQTIVGDTMGRIFEAAGAKVFRANFGGDVGLHVARCLWGIQQLLKQGNPSSLDEVPSDYRAEWISRAYVLGARADEEEKIAQSEIKEINQQVYKFHSEDDHRSELAQIYWRCREWSYDYFKDFYRDIEVEPFDKYYPESSTTEEGLRVVKANLGKVFSESQGAVVFEGEEKDGLHTRVFITSAGLPTYETKDLGVIFTEVKDFNYNRRFLITGSDQVEYMKVVFAALKEIDKDLAAKQTHKPHGTILFGDGQKMSSRRGNVTRAIDVIETVSKAVKADTEEQRRQITLGAVKYSFLKQRVGGDIAFDVTESVSLQGNSGPYLQYAYARARSILSKAPLQAGKVSDLDKAERSFVRKLSEFTRVVSLAGIEFMPHHICTYLYELSQAFNRFYETNRVIGDAHETTRLALVQRYADTLKQGLELLNVPTPEKM